MANHYSGPRCVVAASGISLSEAELFASTLNVSSQDPSTAPSKYRGGEIRKERNSELASVAVAVEGTSLKNQKDAIAFAVLQKVAGDGPRVKWGSNNGSLHKAVATAGQEPFAVSAINVSHSDSGLFGFVLSAPGQIAGAVSNFSLFFFFFFKSLLFSYFS